MMTFIKKAMLICIIHINNLPVGIAWVEPCCWSPITKSLYVDENFTNVFII